MRVKQPLPAGVEAVIRAMQAGAGQLGLEPLLVGATARDLLLVHVFEQPVRRATLDVDFAVALASWEQFEALKLELISGHGFQDEPRQKQRLIYGGEGEGKGMTIDLVPFGGLQMDDNTVAWPPDMDVLMTVTGLRGSAAGGCFRGIGARPSGEGGLLTGPGDPEVFRLE